MHVACSERNNTGCSDVLGRKHLMAKTKKYCTRCREPEGEPTAVDRCRWDDNIKKDLK